jgi:8-oxo-dGDP phosphatase
MSSFVHYVARGLEDFQRHVVKWVTRMCRIVRVWLTADVGHVCILPDEQSAEPADDRDDWDHEVDADFDIPGGEIIFGAPGGGPSTSAEVPAGTYRVRVSGQGFTELGYAGADGDDSYRLRLWPRGQRAAPVLRKRWPGWGSPGTWPAGPRRAGLGRLGGREAQREVAERPGMVVVVALDAMGRVLLIRDDSAGGTATGLPAGPVDQPDGDCLAAARELLDEAGLRAETWSTLLDLPALPGETNAPSRAYLARDLRPVPVAERVRPGGNAEHTSAQPGTTWVTLDQAVSDVFAKVIRNGATAAAVVAAVQARDTAEPPTFRPNARTPGCETRM